jgi:hypothetical protein
MKKTHFPVSFLALAGLLSLLTLTVASAAPGGEPFFNNFFFRDRWVAQDHLVGTPGIDRFYTWGPAVAGRAEEITTEPYKESPGGMRQVQYFDKGRMELNQPTTGQVTGGLLVRDLVTGQRQDGDNTFVSLAPSMTQVAGDDVSVNPQAPVYASFKNVITFGTPDTNSKPSAPGAVINRFINKAGAVSTFSPPEQLTIGAYQAETGHNIAKVFEDFKNLRGPTTDPRTGQRLENQPVYTDNPTVNVFGYAVTEPFWVSTRVAGTERTVLVQLFQRRVLTYNPALSGLKVEMGNLGQHYFRWRYIENNPNLAAPTAIPAAGCLAGTDATGTVVQGCVNNVFPPAGSDVTVYGRLIVSGKLITGIPMTARFGFLNTSSSCDSGPSGADGVASCSVNVDKGQANVNVEVLLTFTYNGTTYQNTLDFSPR